MIRVRALVVACVALVASGCGVRATQQATQSTVAMVGARAAATTTASAAWVDPTYTPKRDVLASLAIAPAPFVGDHADEIDQGIERVFLDTPGSQVRGQPAIIRQRMNGNRGFLMTIESIRSAQYAAADLPQANLAQTLSPKALIDLRTALNSSSMLVMPIEFAVEPRGDTTEGHVFYRVYSLESGKLLLQNRLERRVAAAAEAGRREVTIQLILALQEDFASRLMP